MECPRCSSKVPDNFSYCGFCGIELDTGREKAIERWFDYLNSVMSHNSERQTNLTTMTIASITLSILSLLTFIESIPFPTIHAIAFGILSLIGISVGVILTKSFLDARVELNFVTTMMDMTQRKILSGELRTTKDMIAWRNLWRARTQDKFKYLGAGDKELQEILYGN